MKPQITTDPETLGKNLAVAYSKGARSFYVHNKLPPGSSPSQLLDREYDEEDEFTGDGLAAEIFDAIRNDSELRGGTNAYTIGACNKHGAPMNAWTVTIKTNRESAESVAGLGQGESHALRVVESFFGKYAGYVDKFIARQDENIVGLMAQNKELHEKQIQGFKVIEEALSEKNKRDIERIESEATLRMQEESLKQIMAFAVPIAAQKLGVPEKVVAAMFAQGQAFQAQIAQPEQSAPSPGPEGFYQKKFLQILEVLKTLTPEQNKTIFGCLTDEQIDRLTSAITL